MHLPFSGQTTVAVARTDRKTVPRNAKSGEPEGSTGSGKAEPTGARPDVKRPAKKKVCNVR